MNNQEKNQLIIREILKWKENRLLPEEQCDFLLALYTRGGEIKLKNKQSIWSPVGKKIHFAIVLFVLGSVIFLDYDDQLSWYIMAGILSVVFMINMLIYLKVGKNSSRRYRYLFLFIQFLYVLQLSICIFEAVGLGEYINFVIIANGIGWGVVGYLKKLPIFYYTGLALALSVITYVVFFTL
ncbi:hypothetical protein [Oceanobacillus sp. CFH 90083]|uniref:hypothetical protein n=1 Tax=Oceanobacillus sp. CFH 90083 TaxID=2592336 RepID=UPI00128B277F|nr:hypothetical protein [Oceanobacillus sp. CFH 90083]